MSIFDFLGGTNKFKKGMTAGAKPFEAKFAQHAEALNRLEKKFGADWNKTKAVADQILNSIEATERERLYGLYTQTDIKELKSEYKEILISILYTLSSESGNEFQQSYIRSVQKHLDIKNPQVSIGFSGIGKIDSINAREAIFQSCVEYLFLGNEDATFFEKYGEALFSHFSLDEKQQLVIWENILQIYFAIGPLGLAEKYGFVPEFKDKEKVLSGDESILEQYLIDNLLEIPAGHETVISDREIVLRDDIDCKGKLVFTNCILRYNSNGNNLRRRIRLDFGAELVLNNCTIIGKNTLPYHKISDINKTSTYFILGIGKSYQNNRPKIKAEKCLFLNCSNFAWNVMGSFKDSVIRYTKEFLFQNVYYFNKKEKSFSLPEGSTQEEALKENQIYKKLYSGFISNESVSEIDSCLFEAEETDIKDTRWLHNWLGHFCLITNCVFKNINGTLLHSNSLLSEDKPREINKSYFLNCNNILLAYTDVFNANVFIPMRNVPINMSDCVFENCFNVINLSKQSNIKNCQFINCGDTIIDGGYGNITIDRCDFINVKQPSSEKRKGIKLNKNKDYGSIIIRNCTFDGINYAGFITYKDEKKKFFKEQQYIKIENCTFKHCVAGIIDRNNYDSNNKNESLDIINCTGLDKGDGGQAENPVIKNETASGEQIGTNIAEADVGVPLYQKALT